MSEYTFNLDENALSAAYDHIIDTYNLNTESLRQMNFAQALSRVYIASNTIECTTLLMRTLLYYLTKCKRH